MEVVSYHIVNVLTSMVKRHIGYAIRSTKHINYMERKVAELEEKIANVQNLLDDRISRSLVIPSRVQSWLYEAEHIKIECKSISEVNIGCLNMKMRYRIARKAVEITRHIEILLKFELEIIWPDELVPLATVTLPPSTTSTTPLFSSREGQFNDALTFLQHDNPDCQVIALCGMGGVGKTVMMEQLKKVAQDMKMFDCILKVCIGRNPNIYSIQDAIAVQIGGEHLPDATVTARADYLSKKFKTILEDKYERILFIMDDVWEEFELKNFGVTSSLANGVKLLLTSRYSMICKRIASDAGLALKIVNIDLLNSTEAFSLFSQITEVTEEKDHDIYQIGNDIVKKCGGLPLALKLIGATLKNKDIEVWRNLQDRLNGHGFDEGFDERAQEIIGRSYEYIRQEEDKEIFLLCSLFPKDFDIPIEDLTRHAWGLKLFKQVSTLNEARHKTMICVQNLLNSNLLMRGHALGCVKMHDLVLAFALNRVSGGNHPWFINHGKRFKLGGDEMMKNCKIISLTCTDMSEFPRDFNYPNLSLIQLMDENPSLKLQEDFYDHMKNLQVIAYYNMQAPLLPRSLQNLRSLCLHKCKLRSDCSFLGDLVNLEVLSLAHCGIHEVPSSIGNLRKLKLLDLTGCVNLRIAKGAFMNLTKLEELYMTVSDGKAIRFTDANLEELEKISKQLLALEFEVVERKTWLKNVSFMKLEKFQISMGCFLGIKMENDRYSFENTLKIVTDSYNDLIDCKIDQLFNKTEKLHLQVEDMIQLQNLSRGPYQKHSFLMLRELEVCYCVKLKNLFPKSVASGLRKLQRLTVSSCFALEALVNADENQMIEFSELKFLSLKRLPKLARVFPVNNEVKLPHLVELEVDGLPNFMSIYSDEKNSYSLLNNQVSILELQKLRIRYMESLKQIWAVSSEEEVHTLREIEVESCNRLVNLFPTNPMRLLTHLEELRVSNCRSIEVIFNIDLKCIGHEVSNSSLRVIEVYGLENLTEVWGIEGGEDNSNSVIRFAGVQIISIRECKMFRNVFTPTGAEFYIGASAKIIIDDSEESWRNYEAEINAISSLDAPEVVEDEFNVAYESSTSSSTGKQSFSNDISNLNLGNKPLKVVFEISTTTQEQTPLFPNLKTIRLLHMKRMTHVWKWKEDHSSNFPNQSSFNNLTTISLYQCEKIQYLFSPLIAKLLCNLKKIQLDACDAMEQVVSNRDDKHKQIMASTSTTTFFPNLNSLILHFLRSLKGIGAGNEFKYAREIHISWCDALSEIFQSESTSNNSGGTSNTNNDEGNGGIHNTSVTFPRMQSINVPQLSNLKKLIISYCGILQHVFTFSTLESLRQIQELVIKECEKMKVIVKEDTGDQRKAVEFPNLESLELSDLPNLKGFFLGTNSFEWPSLEKVTISRCPQMEVFTHGLSKAWNLKYIHSSLGKHSLECGLNFNLTTESHQKPLPSSGSTSFKSLPWSFHNLIELHVPSNYDPEVKCIIPSNEFLKLGELERIQVAWCFHVNAVFEVNTTEETHTVILPMLTDVELSNLEDLKYIWNGRKTTYTFSNLKTLSIDRCENLEYVFTSSMVGCLQHLQDLRISTCLKMKEIIIKEHDADENETPTLRDLKFLKLDELQSLEGFWLGRNNFSLPGLLTLELDKCPQIPKGHFATAAPQAFITKSRQRRISTP